MSDKMTPIPFKELLERCVREFEAEKSIFGIPQTSFWKAPKNTPKISLFDRTLENVCGPAAGPHTQLAQNIVVSYLCGARFFELKTVQKIDGEDLPVSKPCIWAKDETFNVEWSTELTVPEAMDEYIKAWLLIYILSTEHELGASDGFIFNMSVGYDLEGIQLPKIDSFIEGLKNAAQKDSFKSGLEIIRKKVAEGVLKRVDSAYIDSISPQICTSVTLSTLHGCPPQEIERIAAYLLTKKNLHTFIKCNPTLLGFQTARNLLDSLGYKNIVFDAHHFEHDLQFEQAVPLIERMQKLAKENGKTFGVKITNTFPVQIVNKELPGNEMYMSGKSLLPLSVSVAQKLCKAFNENLRISFSGGADAFVISSLCKTGMYPITLATTLLKSGGYERLNQVADVCVEYNAGFDTNGKVNLKAFEDLTLSLAKNVFITRKLKSAPKTKIKGRLPLTDCFAAGCAKTCPIEQDIPQYIAAASQGDYEEALRIITAKNPLPFITGTLCSHRCMNSCVRVDYENPVDIRAIKLLCAQKGMDSLIKKVVPSPITAKVSVAVVGAGPAGLSAAFFIRKNGINVTVFEKEAHAGGVVKHIIPPFRIEKNAIENDVAWIVKHGVHIKTNCEFTPQDCAQFDYVILAIGAWKSGHMELEADKKPIECFEFLADFSKYGTKLDLGKTVAVIGAGNSAMDTARAAKKVNGVQNVYVIYRRTKEQMPADVEELEFALHDGVQLKELLQPVSFKNGKLTCKVCILGEPDDSGRRSPIVTDKTHIIDVDTLITATGEKVDTQKVNKFTAGAKKIFLAGDVTNGPATIVEAIADAQKAAHALIQEVFANKEKSEKTAQEKSPQQNKFVKRGVLQTQNANALQETKRCLSCNIHCSICAEVCPNRSNMLIYADQKPQIIHLDALCNECGNCEGFCPYDSAPYLEKFTYYKTQKDFEHSTNSGFAFLQNGQILIRLNGVENNCAFSEISNHVPKEIDSIIQALKKRYFYVL